jgi:hypothetical protein
MLRRRFRETQSLEERLSEEAKRLRAEAKLLPPGAERDEMIRKAAIITASAAACQCGRFCSALDSLRMNCAAS